MFLLTNFAVMKQFLSKYWITLIGIPVGVLGGYVYYYYWGCTNGCPIKSNASKMMLYGAVMGGLLFNMLQDAIVRWKQRS
jgi:hypothetical protein